MFHRFHTGNGAQKGQHFGHALGTAGNGAIDALVRQKQYAFDAKAVA